MTISLKHKFVSAVPDDGDTSRVRPSNWNDEHNIHMASGFMLGRLTAGTGDVEEISAAALMTWTGGVVGPASATDNAIARFDLTTGKLLQNSGATIDDSGNLTLSGVLQGSGDLIVRSGAAAGNNLIFNVNNATGLFALRINGSNIVYVQSSGFVPAADNAQQLGTAALRWSEVNAVLGNFGGPITVNATGGATPSPPTAARFHGVAQGVANVVMDGFGSPGAFSGRRTNGTPNTPTGLNANDVISTVRAYGHDGTSFVTPETGNFRFIASETWSSTARGTKWDLRLTLDGTTTLATVVSVASNGDLTPGASNTQKLGTASLLWSELNAVNTILTGYMKPGSFTVATVPSASAAGAGAVIYVTDETGGATPAFSDGTDWRRVTDRAVIS